MQGKDIFISYQWDIQQTVRHLFDKLINKGYSCWIDETVMGGGDQLHAEMDKGVRNCKLFIPFITAKYVESTNCYKETNLSVILKKPIIPLLIGDVAWPPKGMGTLIGDLLFIRFKNINASPEELWSGKPFDELIAQINKCLCPSAAISSSQPTIVTPAH